MKLGQAKDQLEPWGLLQKGSLLEFLMGLLMGIRELEARAKGGSIQWFYLGGIIRSLWVMAKGYEA